MIIVVTGAIGVGKTTICLKTADAVRSVCPGCGGVITTKGEKGTILAQDVSTKGRMVLAGPTGTYSGPTTERFSFNLEAIDFGREAIERSIGQFLVIVDELGPIELVGNGFANALGLIRSHPQANWLLVIRSELLGSFLPLLGATPVIFEATPENRDDLPHEIERLLLSPGRKLAEAAFKDRTSQIQGDKI